MLKESRRAQNRCSCGEPIKPNKTVCYDCEYNRRLDHRRSNYTRNKRRRIMAAVFGSGAGSDGAVAIGKNEDPGAD